MGKPEQSSGAIVQISDAFRGYDAISLDKFRVHSATTIHVR